ncbi:MAG: zf-HC2 domain-containing protein [Candidatus Eremiobacteraeota bacterium]|nr:zf-HC2 domain-containing protein [Candidatus Eremiobacteraeota bacterium]
MLDDYLEGALRPREGRLVAAHLRGCAGCARLLDELRVVDALLTTARAPGVPRDITAAVVSATATTRPKARRPLPLTVALLLYLLSAWAVAAVAFMRLPDLAQIGSVSIVFAQRDLAALGAASRALAPATPLAAAAVTGVLLIDVVLLAATFYAYRRLRPLLAFYLGRGSRT